MHLKLVISFKCIYGFGRIRPRTTPFFNEFRWLWGITIFNPAGPLKTFYNSEEVIDFHLIIWTSKYLEGYLISKLMRFVWSIIMWAVSWENMPYLLLSYPKKDWRADPRQSGNQGPRMQRLIYAYFLMTQLTLVRVCMVYEFVVIIWHKGSWWFLILKHQNKSLHTMGEWLDSLTLEQTNLIRKCKHQQVSSTQIKHMSNVMHKQVFRPLRMCCSFDYVI